MLENLGLIERERERGARLSCKIFFGGEVKQPRLVF